MDLDYTPNQPDEIRDPKQTAADLARQKIHSIYENEPKAKDELADAKAAGAHRSKHQQFMFELSRSGRSLAEIQTAWHNYYAELDDDEKHEVWREFYAVHGQSPHMQANLQQPASKAQAPKLADRLAKFKPQTVADIKKHLLESIGGRTRAGAKQRFKSLLFGLASGSIAVLILLLSFFNERFIAPFISPSRRVSSSHIIIDPNSTTAATANPTIIIPKINVEVPVVYDQPSIEEKAIQRSLEYGVVHYGISPKPGEKGNAVIVGHSSNNILNRGKYKFAFVLLNRLNPGDTFIITKDTKRYVYRIFDKRIVKPDDLSVLGNTEKAASVTLITCDPPGTAINRLIVVGEQITPDPSANVASSATPASGQPAILPSNAPSLWQRIRDWFTS